MICAGIDAGSRAIKVVLIDAVSMKVVAKGVTDQGVHQGKLARELFEGLLKENRISRKNVGRIVATGYGRNIVTFANTTVTEITCQAIGVGHLAPDAKTIIDIGGQDSKVIFMDGKGIVRDFAMNDRCAAGTGRFLEVVASRLGVKLGSLGVLARKSRKPALISSMCVVFAETEITGLLAGGQKPEDIVAGVQAAVSSRVSAMAGQNTNSPVVFTGGVAMISGMDAALAAMLGKKVRVSPEPQMTCALGAAMLAARQAKEEKV